VALVFPIRARLFSFGRKAVTFFGKDGDRMVECAIALEALEKRFGLARADRDAVFEAFDAARAEIEAKAAAKYAAGKIDPDGIVMLWSRDF
jgi:Protein of unknown function (DUF1488)